MKKTEVIKMDNKFKVGDLIYDANNLYKVISIDDYFYLVKVIMHQVQPVQQPYTINIRKNYVEKEAVLFDINNPPLKVVNTGVCYCAQCWSELHLGDFCIHTDYHVYCSEDCLVEHLRDGVDVVVEADLDSSSTEFRPLFRINQEQLNQINDTQTEEKNDVC